MESVVYFVKSNCDNRELARNNYMPPLGLMSIANVLRLHGYYVEIIDLSIKNYSTEDINQIIQRLNPLLHETLQRTGTVYGIKALFRKHCDNAVAELDIDTALRDTRLDFAEHKGCNGFDVFVAQLVEYDYIVDTVKKFGTERSLQRIHHGLSHVGIGIALGAVAVGKAETLGLKYRRRAYV